MRQKIAEFQSRLKGLTLGHATTPEKIDKIMEQGLVGDYVYACVDEGWTGDEQPVNVRFSADAVADRTYPDPEGQWGEHFDGYSMAGLVEKLGSLDLALDMLEACFNGEGWMEEAPDQTDPRNWNLMVVGPVPVEAIRKILLVGHPVLSKDPVSDIDADIEADVNAALEEGSEYWTKELERFDSGEPVLDLVEQRPLTRQEILDVIESCWKDLELKKGQKDERQK